LPAGSNLSEYESEGAAVDGNTNLYVADASNAAVYIETYANGTCT